MSDTPTPGYLRIRKICQLIFRELVHRKINFLLSALALSITIALFVAFFTTATASKRETSRLMRDIGFNIRIIADATDMEHFWNFGFSDQLMPEDFVATLASDSTISYAHLTATLQQRINWRDTDILLTGIALELSPPGQYKPPMIFSVEHGTLKIGYEIARRHNLQKGDQVELLGKTYTIAQCFMEQGSQDDIRIYGDLKDIQQRLKMPGQINEIMALQCLCFVGGRNTETLEVLEAQLAKILPDTKVVLLRSIAAAREQQRLMIEEYFAVILPALLLACLGLIWVLATMNVRERVSEIGILRAMGYGSAQIGGLFFGKAIVIGLTGAVIGFTGGTWISLVFGPDIFPITAKAISPDIMLLTWSLISAPIFCALAMLVPALMAVTQDPATTLGDSLS
jgi:putative ABC transport system permease protein